MKLIKDKKVLLSALGMIAGLALVFAPVMLGGVESKTLGYVYVGAGVGLFCLSLLLLERYISKRKRPELLRRQEIEARDERSTIIRDKAGARTLSYLLFMMLISAALSLWFDVELEYVQVVMWSAPTVFILYSAHIYYYRKRL